MASAGDRRRAGRLPPVRSLAPAAALTLAAVLAVAIAAPSPGAPEGPEAAVAAVAPGPAAAAPAPDAGAGRASGCPGAEAILDRAAAAQGDAGALAGQRNCLIEGRMEFPTLGLTASMTVARARPNLSYALLASDQLGRYEYGTDGETWWESSTMQGPRIKQGTELACARRDDDFDGLLNWRRWFTAWECAGASEVDGRAAWKLRLKVKGGVEETWHFDQETGLPLRIETVIENERVRTPAAFTFSDYREVDGAMVAFTMRQVLMGGVQILYLRAERVAHNVALDPGLFALPAEVRALRDKQRAAPAGQ